MDIVRRHRVLHIAAVPHQHRTRLIQPPIHLCRGIALIGLHHHEPTRRQLRQRRNDLSPARGQLRTAPDKKRHIAAQPCRQRFQPAVAYIRRVQCPQRPQHRRRVAAAAAQSRLHGNVFLQRDRHAVAFRPRFGKKRSRCLHAQIVVDALRHRHTAKQCVAPCTALHCYGVPQTDALHNRHYSMIAIRTSAAHLKRQVHLGICFFHTLHSGSSQKIVLRHCRSTIIAHCTRPCQPYLTILRASM